MAVALRSSNSNYAVSAMDRYWHISNCTACTAPACAHTWSMAAAMAGSALAPLALGLKRGEPCLVMTRSTVSGAHVASLARLVYPGTRYSFGGKFQL